jgi:hypothetical protein
MENKDKNINKFLEEEEKLIDTIREDMIKDISKYIYKIIEEKTEKCVNVRKYVIEKKYDEMEEYIRFREDKMDKKYAEILKKLLFFLF